LKPENVLRRRSENNHQVRRLDGGNNYVRSLELKSKRILTTGMFNLVVKDPNQPALGGPLRILTPPHKAAGVCPRNLSNIPLHSPCCQLVNKLCQQGAPGLARQLQVERAQYAAPPRLALKKQRAKAPERFDSLKILFWRFRDYR